MNPNILEVNNQNNGSNSLSQIGRSHCTKEKDWVYFELDVTEEETWSTLWIDGMNFTQPESYRNYIVKEVENPGASNIKAYSKL